MYSAYMSPDEYVAAEMEALANILQGVISDAEELRKDITDKTDPRPRHLSIVITELEGAVARLRQYR